jgi:PadR family transcriptional regulator PadR
MCRRAHGGAGDVTGPVIGNVSAVEDAEIGVSLPRNYLRSCLLLLLAEGTSHGYELMEQVRALGLARVDAAGVYRCLRAMDERGLLSSRWQPSTTGPARRTYALTRQGEEQLRAMTGELARTEGSLRLFLNRYAGVAATAGEVR